MSNSSLVSYTKISPNKSSPRNHKIDTITIHCVVGQCSVETLGDIFASSSKQASSNYGIGPDGRIGMYVEEKDRSWCSSNGTNDNRAITIEVASDTTDPYKVTDEAFVSLIKLCADICKRNGIKELKWKADKSLIGQIDKQNMTVHRWFANKSCPGDYLYNRHGEIAKKVNAILNSDKKDTNIDNDVSKNNEDFPKVPFLVDVLIDDLRIRKGPGINEEWTGEYTGKGKFTIKIVKNGWGKLKSGSGWIYLKNSKYCKILKSISDKKDTSYQVSTNIDYLRIRKGPGTNYAWTGEYAKRGVYTIIKTKKGTGSKSGWGKLKSGAGWISLDYTVKA